jgi:hypothetical protein
MASFVELIGTSQTSRARTNDRNFLASADLRRLWYHPSHIEPTIDNSTLDGLDANWILIDTKDTCAFTRGWADTASELGEVVCHEQTIQRIPPLVLEDELIPFGNNV